MILNPSCSDVVSELKFTSWEELRNAFVGLSAKGLNPFFIRKVKRFEFDHEQRIVYVHSETIEFATVKDENVSFLHVPVNPDSIELQYTQNRWGKRFLTLNRFP